MLDWYTIHVRIGVGWTEYEIIRTTSDPDLGSWCSGRSTGLLPMQLAGEPGSEVLTSLAEALFNSASSPPWDV